MRNKEDIKTIFISRLKDLLKTKNLTQVTLSKETKIPPQTISDWLNAKVLPQIDSLVILADFFDVTTDYLLGREDI